MLAAWRKRPLFWAAVLACTSIFLFDLSGLRIPPASGHVSSAIGAYDKRVFLGGTIVSEVERREGKFDTTTSAFLLRASRVWPGSGADSAPLSGVVRVSWRNAPITPEYGDLVVIEGELADLEGRRNPGGFDAKAYWNRQGVDAAFYVRKDARFKILGRQPNPLRAWAIRAKQAMSQRLSEDFEPRTAAFLQALFLGEKRELDEDFRDLFLNTGTMHILAVSGSNIAFLTAAVWLFLRWLLVHRAFKIFVAMAAIWAYCLIVGWQAPVVRASIMATVALAGSLSGRRADGLNALGAAALVILAVHPAQLFDIGFQLSFLAVFGILVFVPRFTARAELWPHERWTAREKAAFSLRELFWVSFVCYALTLVISAQNFFIVTPYSLLANLFVVPAAFLLFFSGIIYFLTFWLPPALSMVSRAIEALMDLLTRALFFVEGLPGAVVTVGRLEPWLAGLLFAGILVLLWRAKPERAWKSAAALVVLCGAVFLTQETWRAAHRRFEMSMIDVGQGDSIFFEFPDGKNMLIDGGGARFSDKGRWAVSPFLRSKGVRTIDTLVISHPQEDHIGGLLTVFKDFHVKNVAHADKPYPSSHTWKKVRQSIVDEGSDVQVVSRGDRIEGVRGVDISVLHPDKDTVSKDINDDSVVLRIDHGGDSFLMTGDIQTQGMRSLLASGQALEADVLKVPHHGAELRNEGRRFVDAVRPKVSLISAGKRNPYGHPALSTVEALEAFAGNQVLGTEEHGMIAVRSDGAALSVTP